MDKKDVAASLLQSHTYTFVPNAGIFLIISLRFISNGEASKNEINHRSTFDILILEGRFKSALHNITRVFSVKRYVDLRYVTQRRLMASYLKHRYVI